MKQLQIMHTEALQAQKEAGEALEKEVNSHKQVKSQLQQNNTQTDQFQTQVESLHLEKAMLQSKIKDIGE